MVSGKGPWKLGVETCVPLPPKTLTRMERDGSGWKWWPSEVAVWLSVAACENAPNRGSDALLMASQISGADDACLQQVDFAPTIHLAFNELQLGDLPLGLTIRPG